MKQVKTANPWRCTHTHTHTQCNLISEKNEAIVVETYSLLMVYKDKKER